MSSTPRSLDATHTQTKQTTIKDIRRRYVELEASVNRMQARLLAIRQELTRFAVLIARERIEVEAAESRFHQQRRLDRRREIRRLKKHVSRR